LLACSSTSAHCFAIAWGRLTLGASWSRYGVEIKEIVVNWLRLALTSTALLLGTLASLCPADEPKKDDQQKVESKAEKRTPATTVDFRKQLNLPFQSLGTLGARIETARKADPVGLAHAANELAVAEQVSGKTASMTSKQLLQESAELAAMRHQVAELQAVLHIHNQLTAESERIAYLKQAIADAKKRQQEETELVQKNEEPTGPRKVVINNYSTQFADIYVNGNLKVMVAPGQSSWFMIEHKWNPTVLRAYGNEDTTGWGPRYIWGTFKTYTWNLQ
jgi:hypothetical protein